MKSFPRACIIVLTVATISLAEGDTDSMLLRRTKTRPITAGQAVILGVVEGVTEFLPISSTGHLIIANSVMSGNRGRIEPQAGTSSFEIIIQIGAIIAVLGLYRGKLRQIGHGIAGRNPAGLRLFGLLCIATAPAVLAGLAFETGIKEHLFAPAPVAAALAAGGIIMIVVQLCRPRHKIADRKTGIESITWLQALLIGIAQTAAMWPGTSRSMVTIVAGLLVGLHILAAAEFSFLLAIPTLGAATAFELIKNYSELQNAASPTTIIVGIAASGIVAAISIKCFLQWLTSHGLLPFGIYRILLAAVVCLYFFA